MLKLLRDGDTDHLVLDDLKQRGLTYADADHKVYRAVFTEIVQELPAPKARFPGGVTMPSMNYLANIKPAWSHGVESRRLDESIKQEGDLRLQLTAAEQDVNRLSHDLKMFAQPTGVLPAFWILTSFSILGIMVPLIIMAVGPKHISGLGVTGLLACFAVGLASVLLYVVWYLRNISDSEQ